MTNNQQIRFDLADFSSLQAILDAQPSPQVTPASRWTEDNWKLPGIVPGINEANFTLRFDVDADRSVIDTLKWLGALLFIGRYGQTTYKYSTAGVFSSGARHLARFMKQRDYRSFDQLDQNAFKEFVDDIHVKLVDPKDEALTLGDPRIGDLFELFEADRDDGTEPMPRMPDDPDATGGIAKAYNRLRIWSMLWIHRDLMAKAGIKPLRFNPFAKESATKIARGLATVAAEEIPALPDEVALPVLAGAVRMIDVPAADVIRLQKLYLGLMTRMDREPSTGERTRLRSMMQDFRFGRVGEESQLGTILLCPVMTKPGAVKHWRS